MCVYVSADFVGDVQSSGLKGEGRRDLEVGLRYGVRINHMITSESIEFSFFSTYSKPLYIYLDWY